MSRSTIEGLLRMQRSLSEAPDVPTKAYVCPICGAWEKLEPPHGWGGPCPLKEKESEAVIAANDAARMSALRQGMGAEDMLDILRKITGYAEDE